MKEKILEIKNLCLSYENWKKVILKDFNFSVFKWEIISIIGKNGAWKSSLLKAILGSKKADSWEIKKFIEKINYVPQKLELDKTFPLNCEDFIKIYNEKIEKKDLENFFEIFGVKNFEKRDINSLSGWEFQKILIINSLISKPDLVLFDEVTAWIDISAEEIFYKNIYEIKKIFPEISIILVSHNLNLVYKNSDRIICLHEWGFCCHGKPEEISKNSEIEKNFWNIFWEYKHNPHEKH